MGGLRSSATQRRHSARMISAPGRCALITRRPYTMSAARSFTQGRPQPDVHHAARRATEARGAVARVEIQAVEHLRGDGAPEAAEVIRGREKRPVVQHERVGGRGSSHDE